MRYRSSFLASGIEKLGILVVIGLFTYQLFSAWARSPHVHLQFGENDDSEHQAVGHIVSRAIADLRTPLKAKPAESAVAGQQGSLANQPLERAIVHVNLLPDRKPPSGVAEPQLPAVTLDGAAASPQTNAVEPQRASIPDDTTVLKQATVPLKEALPNNKNKEVVENVKDTPVAVEVPVVMPEAPAVEQAVPVASGRNKSSGYKTIHFWVNVYGNDLVKQYSPDTSRAFAGCPVKTCQMTNDHSQLNDADALFVDVRHMLANNIELPVRTSLDQIWIVFDIEAPTYFPQHFDNQHLFDGVFNATLTYSLEATIPFPYVPPYERKQPPSQVAPKNYAAGRTKLMLWIVSNCGSRSQRERYAQELSRYVSVEVVGRCAQEFTWNHLYNDTSCEGERRNHCVDTMGQTYKFYFASENSICPEYVTEKLSRALDLEMVPIVIGGAEYKRHLPPNSYIDVRDFASPAALAKHLIRLDQNDDLYNEYFQWKGEWQKGPYLDYLCLVCSFLHSSPPRQTIESMRDWYSKDTCTTPAKYFHGHNGDVEFLDNHNGGVI